MSSATPPPPDVSPRLLRRWGRRLALSLLVLLLLLLAFHRPIIRLTAAYFGQRAARNAGMDASWILEGNFFSGMNLRDVKVVGNEDSKVRTVSLDHANFSYSLADWSKHGVGAVLKEITLSNLTAELDLTKPGEVAPSPQPGASKPSGPLPALQFPKVNLTHLNLRLQTHSGLVEIEDFSLTLDRDAPGIISWAKVVVPGIPPLGPMRGITKLTPQSLQLENLALRPDTLLEQFSVDIAQLVREEVEIKLGLLQGGAKLRLDGKVENWSQDLSTDVKVTLDNLHPADLASWGVPAGEIAWGVTSLAIRAQGPVLKPQELKAKVVAQTEPLKLSEWQLNGAQCEASLERGVLKLAQLAAGVGENTVVATGEATLPAKWEQVAQANGKIALQLDAKNLSQLSPQIEGAATVDGVVEFAGQQLSSGTVNVNAKKITAAGIPIQSLEVKATSAQEMATIEQAKIVLNAQNTISATGSFGLTGNHALTAEWNANCADLASLPTQIKAGTIWPSAGTVRFQGAGTASLTAIQKRDWSAFSAHTIMIAKGVKLNGASLEYLNLQAAMAQGGAELEQLVVQLDPENSVQAKGQCLLSDPGFPLTAEVHVELPNVAALSAWGEPFGAPKLEAGSAQIHWKADGNVQPMSMNGLGTANVSGLKLSGVPEVLGLKATIEQTGQIAKIPALEATAGPWRAVGNLDWDGKRLNIGALQGLLKEVSLVKLSASLPLDYQAEPLQLKLAVDQLDTAKVASALGQPFPARGMVSLAGEFSGTLKELSGTLQADVTQIVIAQPEAGKLQPGTVRVRGDLTAGKLTVNGSVNQKPLETLSFQGVAPVNLPELMNRPALVKELPFAAKILLPKSALNFLPSFVPLLHRIDGTLSLNTEIKGTVKAPKIEGGLQAEVLELVFADTSLPGIKNLQLNLLAKDERVSIRNAEMLVSGGPLKLMGEVGLQNLQDPALDLKLLAEEILVKRDDMISLRANADISCLGKLSTATVQGKVDLVRGRVFKEVEIVPLSLPQQLPPPPASTKLGRAGLPELPVFLHPWKFDVAVKSKDPIRLMSTVANGSVLVDILLAGTGAKPEIMGKIKLRDTSLKLPFSRLKIVSGEVTIDPVNPLDPQIELVGESVVANYMVTLNATGRALDPKLRFVSSPPLSEGDITMLLATGTTAADLGASNGEAAGRALYLVFQSAYRKLFPNLASAAEELEPPKLSFELSGFGNDPKRRGVAAIYEISPKVKAIGRVGENGTFRGTLHYQIRFK